MAAGVAAVVSLNGNASRGGADQFFGRVGEGVVALGASVVLAAVATVLLHARGPAARPEGPVVHRMGDDLDTPPFGIPVVEGRGGAAARPRARRSVTEPHPVGRWRRRVPRLSW
ncbi:hypothetical protein ACIGNX_26550 [Actinosynnema sp. NPDC053489]|uniref:hypothetical protein n=1 Tax=Actinosynnema sp. NPDC053489 TaxID=3363916 RepID=UPI0037C724CE